MRRPYAAGYHYDVDGRFIVVSLIRRKKKKWIFITVSAGLVCKRYRVETSTKFRFATSLADRAIDWFLRDEKKDWAPKPPRNRRSA